MNSNYPFRVTSILVLVALAVLQLGSSSLYSQSLADTLERQLLNTHGDEHVAILLRLGELRSETDPERALEMGLKAVFLSKRGENTELEGRALLLMGLSSLRAGEQENALRYYNRALTHFERIRNREYQVDALDGISAVYQQAQNPALALSYLRRAVELATIAGRTEGLMSLHHRLGDLFLAQRSYTLALREYTQVLNLLEAKGRLSAAELKQKAKLLTQTGLIYRNQGQLNESLYALRMAYSIGREIQPHSSHTEIHYEIGLTHFILQQYDSSLVYFNRVLSHHQLQRDSSSLVGILQSIGDVFIMQELFPQALTSLTESLRFAELTNNIKGQVSALVSISRCYLALNDYPLSNEYLNKALGIAKSANLTSSAADVYMYLSLINEEQGRYMQALQYHKLWTEIKDSIYVEMSGQQLARMQILHEITQKDRENEILKQNSQIQELMLERSRYQRLVFIAVALLLLVLLILLGFLFKGKQREIAKQRETEQKIVDMNRELEKRMIVEVKKQEQQQVLLAQKSKLESLGTLAAGIAHEINQPLGGISMGLDNILIRVAENSIDSKYLKDKANLMFENVERIKRIIDHIRTFSRTQKPATMERVDINEVVVNALTIVQTQFESPRIKLDVLLNHDLEPVVADKYKLEQVLLNLLSNARYALDDKESVQGSYSKTIRLTTRQDQENVYLTVWDNGTGIKSKDMEKIFDPFFTTKKQDKGTGLGLAISYGFINDIMGKINVDSAEGEYTQFEISIPK